MAITLTLSHKITDDELLELAGRNPGYQFERNAKGELVVTPTGMESGRASGEVLVQLGLWNRKARGGVVLDSSTGFRLPDGALLSPDASWVRRDRWDALTPEQRKRFGPLCPDVVFEIRSESNTLVDLREKTRAYLTNGDTWSSSLSAKRLFPHRVLVHKPLDDRESQARPGRDIDRAVGVDLHPRIDDILVKIPPVGPQIGREREAGGVGFQLKLVPPK